MEEKKSTIATSIIKSVTALICSAALALTGSSITDKVCENKKAIAEKGGSSATAVSGTVTGTDSFAGDTAADDTSFADDTTAADDTSFADDTTAADDTAAPVDNTTGGSTGTTQGKQGGEKKAAAKEITLTSGLESKDKAEVLKYYKLVAAKNAKGTYNTKMTMTKLYGGEKGVAKIISSFESIAQKALAKNSVTTENIPGDPAKILESDWESATATNDGTYTILNIKLKPQTDGANGHSKVGTVGRTIDVLDGVQTALDELPGVSADFANGKFELVYDQAYATIKVKNSTGEFVKGACTWHYRVNVNMNYLEVKVIGLPITLVNAQGIIDYTIKN